MNALRAIWLAMFTSMLALPAGAEDFTNAIHAHLQQSVDAEKIKCGIVVGLVDEAGNKVVSYGKLDNGTDQEVNGDTLFEIGSITKTFTTLLLQDMVDRSDMKLNDPVAKYLPASVRVPTRNGKQITLLHLATHCSGLPREPENLQPKLAAFPCDGYTVEKLDEFLSSYRLTRDPGAQYEYSSAGMAVLARAIELKAGTNYETLVVDRICHPLQMNSTLISVPPEVKGRCAVEHSPPGCMVPSYDFHALAPAGALWSTANDMLKYLSAGLGITPLRLSKLMQKTHAVHFRHADPDMDMALAWATSRDPDGTTIVWHVGALDGCVAFAGFDEGRHRAVVVLCNSRGYLDIPGLGRSLLRSEWQSDKRPKGTRIPSQVYDWCVGQYRPPRAVFQPGIGIRREGDRLFAQAVGSRSWPVEALLAPITAELLAASETQFFERLSGTPVAFVRDAQGKVTGLTMHYRGNVFSYEKTSDEPPKAPEPPRRPVVVKLDAKLLAACAGDYQIAPDVMSPMGAMLTIRREGDHLVVQIWDKRATRGAIDIYPESETKFFLMNDGSQLTFIKNDKGEVTEVIHHFPGIPDHRGKRGLDTSTGR